MNKYIELNWIEYHLVTIDNSDKKEKNMKIGLFTTLILLLHLALWFSVKSSAYLG